MICAKARSQGLAGDLKPVGSEGSGVCGGS